MSPTTDPRDLIYTPSEIVTIGSRNLDTRRRMENYGIPLYHKTMDDDTFFLPAVPGDLITVIGRPGNGKTGFMMRWARTRAAWLRDHGKQNRVVIYATWEQSIEELYAFQVAADAKLSVTDMARGKMTAEAWGEVQRIGAERIGLPLWFIGHSLERRKKRPLITVSALAEALDNIDHWGDERTQIDMVFVDYLQRIPFTGKVESKTIGVSDNLDRLKDGALTFGCPFIVGVQATREVEKHDLPIPTMDDGQWTSNIEQASDKIFTLVRPRKYRREGEAFGSMIVQGTNQMLVTLAKQKLGPDNISKWVYFNPAYNRLDEIEIRNMDDSIR